MVEPFLPLLNRGLLGLVPAAEDEDLHVLVRKIFLGRARVAFDRCPVIDVVCPLESAGLLQIRLFFCFVDSPTRQFVKERETYRMPLLSCGRARLFAETFDLGRLPRRVFLLAS